MQGMQGHVGIICRMNTLGLRFPFFFQIGFSITGYNPSQDDFLQMCDWTPIFVQAKVVRKYISTVGRHSNIVFFRSPELKDVLQRSDPCIIGFLFRNGCPAHSLLYLDFVFKLCGELHYCMVCPQNELTLLCKS